MSNYQQYPGYGYGDPYPPSQSVQPYQPYGGYGYQPPVYVPDHPSSTTVLVLGILSLVVCGITGPFAWYMGTQARREMDMYPGRYGSSGGLTAGWVMGIISTILLIMGVLFYVVYFLIIGVMLAAYS